MCHLLTAILFQQVKTKHSRVSARRAATYTKGHGRDSSKEKKHGHEGTRPIRERCAEEAKSYGAERTPVHGAHKITRQQGSWGLQFQCRPTWGKHRGEKVIDSSGMSVRARCMLGCAMRCVHGSCAVCMQCARCVSSIACFCTSRHMIQSHRGPARTPSDCRNHQYLHSKIQISDPRPNAAT